MGEPYPHAVRFDHGKADAAVRALNDAIALLRSQTNDRRTNATRMRRHWTGGRAEQFDCEVRRMETDAAALIGSLQAWVRTITSASDAATTLQRAHDRANRDWRDDRMHSVDPPPGA
ncbi:MAG TPA: hypothetical protein VIC57_16400 [Candidatus Dormibacteraeota bacterium]